ncbi:MAG: hypothetical protein ACRCS9_13310 [Hyphomicrobium sp.]
MNSSVVKLWLCSLAFAVSLGGVALALTKDPKPAPAASTNAKAFNDVWPKPVATFLEGQYLDRADVVLTRRSGDIASYIIRWATSSPFSHAALVFTGPQFDAGVSGTFVIEAGTSGVDLTKLADYAENKSTFIAIKRLRKDWFNAPKQSRVRGVLLDKIKASYDFWAIWKITRTLWFGVQSKMRTKEKTVEAYRKNDWSPPNEYICSGLVQIGFVEMAVEAIKRGELSPEVLRDVVFHKGAESRLPAPGNWKYLGEDADDTAISFRDVLSDELFSVTPEDLAQSDKLEWLYFIKNGLVHKVSSYADVLKLIN